MAACTNPSTVSQRFACGICGRSGPGSYIGEACGPCHSWGQDQSSNLLIARVERLLALRHRRLAARSLAEAA